MYVREYGKEHKKTLLFFPVSCEPWQEFAFAGEELAKRFRVLQVAFMFIVPMIMILLVNGARSWFDCAWQFYVLFLGAEFFDWLFIDTIWAALSDWWLIPGAEDLEPMWHTPKAKAWKMPKLVFLAMPLAVIVGAVYWAIGLLLK